MKIIVFSDSHGERENMREVLRRNRHADLVIHLGDGTDDMAEVLLDFPMMPCRMITGNREEYFRPRCADAVSEDITNLCGCKIFACHGHRYHVKLTEAALVQHAASMGADIILYGHTHRAVVRSLESESAGRTVHIMNPGSVGAAKPTYGVIEITDGKVTAEIKEI